MAMVDAQRWMFRGLMAVTALAIGAELVGMVRSVGDEHGERGAIVVTQVKTIEVPVENQPVVSEPECRTSPDDGKPIEKWTIGEDHFGPFVGCATIDRAYVERAMPGYEVVATTTDHGRTQAFQVLANKRQVLLVTPKHEFGKLSILSYEREIETPWRLAVGDKLKKLRGSFRDVYCTYTSDDDRLWCQRSGMGGGWTDTLAYSLNLAPLGTSRAQLFEYDFNDKAHLDRLNGLAIDAISWTAR